MLNRETHSMASSSMSLSRPLTGGGRGGGGGLSEMKYISLDTHNFWR